MEDQSELTQLSIAHNNMILSDQRLDKFDREEREIESMNFL